MRRAALALLLAALLLAPLGATRHGGVGDTPLVSPFSVVVDGETAEGLLAVPAGAPHGIVALMRGYNHNASSHDLHLQHLAEKGWIAFAMDFRGQGMPLGAGAADTMAALDAVKLAYPAATDRIHLYSVSMGTAAAAIVLAERDDIDVWVNNEGLSMLTETWAEATAVSPGIAFGAKAAADIEAECGGSPAVAPACYVARSATLRAHEFSIDAAVLTHGLNDGLVPYDQGRSMVAALRAAGVPSDFYTVATCPPGSEGTSITGHATGSGFGVCGHGTESDDTHTLTALSFALLDRVLDGALVPADREHVVDGALGTLP